MVLSFIRRKRGEVIQAQHVNELQIAAEQLDAEKAAQTAVDALETEVAAKLPIADVLNEPDMATGATDKPPSQASVKAYVDEYGGDLEDTIEDDPIFAVVDKDDRRTWVEIAPDGGLTSRAVEKIGEHIAGAVDMDTDVTGLSFAIVDEDDRRTWLEADAEGKPTERALSLITDGIGDVELAIDHYLDHDGTEHPIISGPDIICWGDSMTQGAGGGGTTYPGVLATLTGHMVRNGGVGGEGSSGILARQGGNPFTVLPVGGSIPASGSVDITFAYRPGWPLLQGAGTDGGDWTGSLAGVHGTISITKETPGSLLHEDGDVYTFTRTASGDAVAVDRPVPFYSDFSEARRADIAVFWYGRNDLAWNDPDQIHGAIDASIQHLVPLDKRFLVLSVCNGAGETTGTTNHTRVQAINTALRRFYGRRFVDVRQYLIDYGLDDAGITPTAQDEADIAGDTIPASLRVDTVHFTADGYEIVAAQVAARLAELEWI